MTAKSPGLIPKQTTYRIEIQGRLDEGWSDWFNGGQIEYGADTTILTSQSIDQPRLRGILGKMWDLNLTVISVNRIEDHPDEKGGNPDEYDN